MNNVQLYFKNLYENCQGYFEVRFIKADENVGEITPPPADLDAKVIKGIRFLFNIQEVIFDEFLFEKLYEWVKENNRKGYHVYYGVIPRDENGEPQKEKIKWVYQDIDIRWEKIFEFRNKIRELVKVLKDVGIELESEQGSQFNVIYSGRGLQLIAKIEEEIDYDTWLKAQKKLAFYLNERNIPVDIKVAVDIARILRFPDTVNWKYDDENEADIFALQELPLSVNTLLELPVNENTGALTKRPERIEKEREEREGRDLSEKQIDKIVKALVPVWKKGIRNKLTLGLIGFCIKNNVKKETTERLIRKICILAQDEEEEQRVYLVNYHYDRRVKELGKEKLAGITAIKEALQEAGYDNEKVDYILQTLQETIGYDKNYNIYVKVDYMKNIGFANVVNGRKKIFRWKVIKDKETEDTILAPEKVIIDGAITDIIVRYNPLTKEKSFEVEFDLNTRRRLRIKGSIQDLIQTLKKEGVIWHSRMVEDCLSAILTTAEQKGIATVLSDFENEGFYFNEGKLYFKGEFKKYTEEEVKEALNILNTLVEKYFAKNKEKASHTIKWIITAPFQFARKMKGLEPWKWLILIGYSGTGKTTLASLIGDIWGLPPTFETSAGSISTQARIAKILSRWTYPTVINEAKDIFTPKREEIRELIKNAWDRIIAREKFKRGGEEWQKELALSPLLLTANVELDLTPAERRRFDAIRFTAKEKPKPAQKREFNKWKKELKKLNALAREIYEVVKENPEILEKETYEEAGREILKKMYEKYLDTVPGWVEMKWKESLEEETEEELKDQIIVAIQEYVNEKYLKYKGRLSGKNIIDRLEDLQKMGIPSDILYWKREEKLVIRHNFVKYLRDQGIEVASLDDLADILGGETRKTRIRTIGVITPTKLLFLDTTLFTGGQEEKDLALMFYIPEEKVYKVGDYETKSEEELLDKIENDPQTGEEAFIYVLDQARKMGVDVEDWSKIGEEYERGNISAYEACLKLVRLINQKYSYNDEERKQRPEEEDINF